MVAKLSPPGWGLAYVLPRIWSLAVTQWALPLLLWCLLLDSGLLVEGTGCPTFCKGRVGTVASESCGVSPGDHCWS